MAPDGGKLTVEARLRVFGFGMKNAFRPSQNT